MAVPEIGTLSEPKKDAYEMYNTYARQIGFNIRKSDTKRWVHKPIYSKRIVCSGQGFGEASSSQGITRTVTMLVFSLVLAERGFGQCIRLKLDKIII
jgi:hypothetical protein